MTIKPIQQVCTATAKGQACHFISTEAIHCKYCGSKNVIKYGKKGEMQYYECKDCQRHFAYNNALPGMRYPPEQIATAVGLFYDGLSIDTIRRQIDSIFHVYPSDSTVYDWIVRFSEKAVKEARFTNLKVGDTWIADETVLKMEGQNVWFWDIIDDDTRFLLASRMSYTRTTKDAQRLFELASKRANKVPSTIITDKLYAYMDGVELTFGGDTEHIRSHGFNVHPNTNLIERFHGTLKARTKVMRGLSNFETAITFTDGWLVNYNFFRPHESLGNKTPAHVAKADFPYTSWKEVIMGGILA